MRFESKYGHFSADGLEYVVTRPDTPRPWVNVISNGDYGLIVSQVGSGFSWRTHSNLNRLTRWVQDLLKDEWGKYIYLRDEENGEFWSATWQPTGHAAEDYRCRHGLGYSVIEQRYRDIESSMTVLAAPEGPCEIWLLRVKNVGDRPRTLSATSYLEWNLGVAPDSHREFHRLFIEPQFWSDANAIVASKRLWEVPTDRGHWNTDWPYLAFHGVSEPVGSFDADKESFMGRHRGVARPLAMEHSALAGNAGRWGDAIAALRNGFALAPGEERTLVYVLGAADDEAQARELIARYGTLEGATAALEAVKQGWRDRLSPIQVETPDPAFDLLTNVWLKYQAISGHMWARAAYYQQSGALGFRDQLQTSQIWLPLDPRGMRGQLLLHARHQLQAGTVLHWWHPLTDQGLATDMTDDLLWLPYMTTTYLKETLDWGLLEETVPFHDGEEASFREHCQRAIGVVLGRLSERGLPLIGAGDWCDGFSSVGLDWKGESIWLGHFLYRVLLDWAEIVGDRLPQGRVPLLAEAWRASAQALKEALDAHAWQGDRYLCATRDDGGLMGDASCDQNQIYLNAQTWAVLAGSADDARAATAMETAHRLLEGDNGMVLLAPAYHTVDRGIGYITRYAPGSRENGGVYTHAATWAIRANCMRGDAQAAYRLFGKLNPIVSAERDIERYWAEPYVLPGNIDGPDSPHYGRGGWTWYTGAAGWLSTIAHEDICGVQPTYEGLRLAPCLPADWDGIRIQRSFRGCRYDIRIRRTEAEPSLRVDGHLHPGPILPHFSDGEVHAIDLTLKTVAPVLLT